MDQDALLKKARDYCAAEQDPRFRGEVAMLIETKDFDELNERFYTSLSFGTGGLRGVIGGGYNRMNPFTVRQATQGLAAYIGDAVPDHASAVIAYDSRNFSDTFALEAALVLAGNGIKTYLFTALRPTPELSFAVRQLKATAGIVVTASHNPKQYNGYKVYWSDGGQIVPPHDKGIIDRVKTVTAADIVGIEREKARATGMLVMIDKEIDDAYIDMVKSQSLRPQLIKEKGSSLKVVYTPLHGAGGMPFVRTMQELGIEVTVVPEQKEPNGNFPTVAFPNPEIGPAMAMALELAMNVKADLVMGTDPDADRLGIAVPEGDTYRLITGNQLGALLADYIFSTRIEMGTMPEKPAFVKTIVTTELQRSIADAYTATCFETLTGFKYIAEKIREFETGTSGYTYLFGGEESYGYLVGTAVRDKDAVSAAAMTAEMALYHVSQGRSLIDALETIWKKHGYFEESLFSKYFEGQSGLEIMNGLMETLRKKPLTEIAGTKVIKVNDYRDGTALDCVTGAKTKNITLPSSNVIQFITEDGSIVTARPSGTEPKIKFYCSMRGNPGADLAIAREQIGARVKAVMTELKKLTDR